MDFIVRNIIYSFKIAVNEVYYCLGSHVVLVACEFATKTHLGHYFYQLRKSISFPFEIKTFFVCCLDKA